MRLHWKAEMFRLFCKVDCRTSDFKSWFLGTKNAGNDWITRIDTNTDSMFLVKCLIDFVNLFLIASHCIQIQQLHSYVVICYLPHRIFPIQLARVTVPKVETRVFNVLITCYASIRAAPWSELNISEKTITSKS